VIPRVGTWTGVSAGAASVALIMDDPAAPSGTFTHWVVCGQRQPPSWRCPL
jgi:phosphatidylethanolamine-binding protein (PEBP) family uncharacterized protein